MANFNFYSSTRQIAVLRSSILSTTIKLQKTAASIGFVQYALHNGLTPTFARVKGNFRNKRDKRRAEESILKSELYEHRKTVQAISSKLEDLVTKLREITTPAFCKCLQYLILSKLRKNNIEQLKTKTKKLRILLNKKPGIPNVITESVPVINLSSYDVDTDVLKNGLNHCFIDKNKYERRTIATEFENLASSSSSS